VERIASELKNERRKRKEGIKVKQK